MPFQSHLKLKPFYTYAELAKLMDISGRRVERLCKTRGIKTERVGVRHVVMVADLETKMPMLWASMIACERARATSRYLDALTEAERARSRCLG